VSYIDLDGLEEAKKEEAGGAQSLQSVINIGDYLQNSPVKRDETNRQFPDSPISLNRKDPSSSRSPLIKESPSARKMQTIGSYNPTGLGEVTGEIQAAVGFETGNVSDIVQGAALIFGGSYGRLPKANLFSNTDVAKGVTSGRAVWAQKTFGKTFSLEGDFVGHSVESIANDLRSGALSVMDVPIDVVVRDGQIFILNTRSSAALMLAGIPRSSWVVVNQTGFSFFEKMLTGQLVRNGLINGTTTIRQSGTQIILSQ